MNSCSKSKLDLDEDNSSAFLAKNYSSVPHSLLEKFENKLNDGASLTENHCDCSVEIISIEFDLSQCPSSYNNIAFSLDSNIPNSTNGFCSSSSCLKFVTGFADVNDPLCDPNNNVACVTYLTNLNGGTTVDLNCEIPHYDGFILRPFAEVFYEGDCTIGSCIDYEGSITFVVHCLGELFTENCESRENMAYTTYSSDTLTIDFDYSTFSSSNQFGIVLDGCGCEPNDSNPSSF